MLAVEGHATAEAARNPDGGWTVTATFVCDTPTERPIDRPIDRPGGYPWSLRPSLAQRLVRAVEDGKVFTDYRIGTDINGQTYLSATNTISTPTMNADLAALGY